MPTVTARRTEHPILMSSPMVRALLDGRKSTTMRVMKCQPPADATEVFAWFGDRLPPGTPIAEEGCYYRDASGLHFLCKCPYGRPGDSLWVRETFRRSSIRTKTGISRAVEYRADGARIERPSHLVCQLESGVTGRWRPSIHMPRWASRLTLRIAAIDVIRPQGVTENAAIAEGVTWDVDPSADGHTNAVEAFRSLWFEINGERDGCDWEANAMCWRLAFSVEKREATP